MRRTPSNITGLWCGLATLFAFAAGALEVGSRVGNFELLDQHGQAHELHYLSDARAVVLMAHTTACPELADSLSRFDAVAAAYRDSDVAFLLVNSDGLDYRQAVAGNGLDAKTPILVDETRLVGKSLGVTEAGETLIVDPKTWRLVHRGDADVGAALKAFLAGREPTPEGKAPSTCSLRFPDRPAEISYAEDVAPILAANCVTCHRAGGIGPWAMTDYNMVRGFAPMIREVLLTKRMPPWHADPAHGRFSNDRSLTVNEVQTLVHWIEAGAPRGGGDDPLASLKREWPDWQLGEPDLVLDIPAFDVPATGVVEYKYRIVRNPLDRDVWVRATEIVPGDRAALHHVITSFRVPSPDGNPRGRRGGGLGGYVPGRTAREFPDNTGTLLPAGATLIFQMHYTPYGKAVTDRSKLGLYFHDEKPLHRLAGAVLMNTNIRIPANTKSHRDFAEHTFERDVLVYTLLPHAHYRGKASEFRAFYPDGTEELLLSVPNYDFNWQTTYVLEEPKVLPAGTRVVHTTWWDNSAQNPANPDPNREVPWGRQSWDEMLFGAISLRHIDEELEVAAAGAE